MLCLSDPDRYVMKCAARFVPTGWVEQKANKRQSRDDGLGAFAAHSTLPVYTSKLDPILCSVSIFAVSNVAVLSLTDGILWKKHFTGHNRSRPLPGPESLMETIQGNPGWTRLHPSAGIRLHASVNLSNTVLKDVLIHPQFPPLCFRVWFTGTWNLSTSSWTHRTMWRLEILA